MSEAKHSSPNILNANEKASEKLTGKAGEEAGGKSGGQNSAKTAWETHPKANSQSAQPRLVIIGAGPGGYSAAIRASQLGAAVTLIERAQVGGTCLNWGCIPSKIMRRAADIAHAVNNTDEAALFGVATHNSPKNHPPNNAELNLPLVDLPVLRARQNSVINAQVNGLTRHFKTLEINLIKGEAKLEKLGEVAVTLPDGSVQHFAYDHLLLAIGSAPASLPGLDIDGHKIISSNQALWMEKLPKSMLVVGGGVIGCELAQIFHNFGVKVTLVEALPRLLPLPSLDEEISKTYARSLKKAKLPFYVGHTVAGVTQLPEGLSATIKPFNKGNSLPNSGAGAGSEAGSEAGLGTGPEPGAGAGSEVGAAAGSEAGSGTGSEAGAGTGAGTANSSENEQSFNLQVEQILVATGRKSIAASLSPQGLDGLRALGLGVNARGWIEAGPNFHALCAPHNTNSKACNIWAIGDCLGPEKVMLAHVATAEGLAAVENMLLPQGQNQNAPKTVDYNLVPSAMFTAPEIASAGLSLAQAQAKIPESKAYDFLFRQLGKAQAMNETDGLTRLVCAPDGTILGGHIIGPCATSLIAEITLAVQQGLKASDLANTIHAHPTLPEGIWEAALSASGKPLHGS